MNVGLGPIKYPFLNALFPLGAIHEFITSAEEDIAVIGGFIAGIKSTIMRNNAIFLWISSSRKLFPLALKHHNIEPYKIIFVDWH